MRKKQNQVQKESKLAELNIMRSKQLEKDKALKELNEQDK